jgi:flagellar hook-length control protein FliK
MTIEKSPAASAHKATAAAHGAKSRPPSGDTPNEAAGAGFLAILGAQGEAQADPTQGGASDGAEILTSVAAAKDAAPLPLPFDASTLLQQNPQIAAAQAQTLAAAVGTTQPLATAAQLATDPGLQAQQQAVLLAGQPVPSATSGLPVAAEAEPQRPVFVRTLVGEAARKDASTALPATSLAGAASESASVGQQRSTAHAKPGQAELQTGAAATTASNAAVANERAEPNKFLAALQQAQAPQAALPAAPQLTPLLARVEKTQSERERAGLDQKNADPGYAGTSVGVSSPDYSLVSTPDAAMTPDMQVAEQVSYWVSQNVQNAELKLDGLGQNPVEVSISMQGNEAQISFRSDEAATRGLLESAGAHLKDMLLREGLVLGGVSVGTSGSGDSNGNERRARQNVRQGVIAPLKVDSLDGGPCLRTVNTGGAGRSVDLFV